MFDNNEIEKNSPVPLYYQLKQIILNYIENKENGTALPTADEICNHYKISKTTVRQTLNELVNEGYIFRQKGKGTVVQKMQKSLSDIYRGVSPMMMYAPMEFKVDEDYFSSQKSHKIALSVKSTEIAYFDKLYKSALDEFKKYNIDALCFDSHSDIKKQLSDLKYLVENNFELIILDPCSPPKGLNKILKTAYESNIPVIAMNSHVDSESPHLTYIGCDNMELGYRVGIYTTSIIRQNMLTTPLHIAIIQGPKGNIAGKEREIGFINGIFTSLKRSELNICEKFRGDWSKESGYAATKHIVKDNPDISIIFSYNDSMAIGGIQACKEIGREDIFFVSIDGSPEALKSLLNEEQIKVIGINDPVHIGRLTAEIALRFLNSKNVPSKTILTEPMILSAENIHSYYNSYKKRK